MSEFGFPQGTEEQRQEAASKRYVDAARVVALDSGEFAVYSMARGDLVGVVIEEALPGAIVEATRRSVGYFQRSLEEETARRNAVRPQAVQKAEVNLEDLGF